MSDDKSVKQAAKNDHSRRSVRFNISLPNEFAEVVEREVAQNPLLRGPSDLIRHLLVPYLPAKDRRRAKL